MRIIAAAFAVLMLSHQGAFAETRIALVIGNGAYEEGPLDNPPRDAELMAETLRDLDFAVTFEKNVDQRTMKRLIAAFGDRLRETSDAVAFFYYSGHGMQVKGRNYMIPVDARIHDEPDVEIDGVSAWRVLTNMEYAQTTMNVVVLDACRNNPFEKRFKSPQEGVGLAPMQAPAGTLIAYATAPGDVADPGPRGGGTVPSPKPWPTSFAPRPPLSSVFSTASQARSTSGPAENSGLISKLRSSLHSRSSDPLRPRNSGLRPRTSRWSSRPVVGSTCVPAPARSSRAPAGSRAISWSR